MEKTRILAVSGGNRVGQSFLDSLAGRRAGLELVATNSVPTDIPLFDFDAVYLTPETAGAPAAFKQRFSEILAIEKPDLVIPCRDDDVAFLAAFKEARPEAAVGFLCGSRLAAEATCDKWLSWLFCFEHDLPFVPTLVTPAPEAAAFAREHGFPLVIKPRRGYASRGVYFVFNEAQLLRAAAQEGHVIQKYLGESQAVEAYVRSVSETGVPLFHSFEGIDYQIYIFIAPDGSAAGNFCLRNMRRNGASFRRERHESSETTALGVQCIHAFAKAGWRGPLDIQCQRTPSGKLFIYEFNGRFTGSTAARCLMGYDEVGLALASFCGKQLKPVGKARSTYPQAVHHALDITPNPGDVAILARDGIWRRQA